MTAVAPRFWAKVDVYDEANTLFRQSDGRRECRECNRRSSRARYRRVQEAVDIGLLQKRG